MADYVEITVNGQPYRRTNFRRDVVARARAYQSLPEPKEQAEFVALAFGRRFKASELPPVVAESAFAAVLAVIAPKKQLKAPQKAKKEAEE